MKNYNSVTESYIAYIISQYATKKQRTSLNCIATVPDMYVESLRRLCRSLGDPESGF